MHKAKAIGDLEPRNIPLHEINKLGTFEILKFAS